MVALDSAFATDEGHGRTVYTAPIVLTALAVAVWLAAGTLLFEIGNSFAWRDAAENVSRFSLLIFVAAIVVEPLSRIFRAPFLRGVARERSSLILAFVVVSFVALVCSLALLQQAGAQMSVAALGYSVLSTGILIVMLFSEHPSTRKRLGGPAWRTMQRIAIAYFWLVFAVTALNHLTAPDVTDRWWGISLLLLITAVLVQFVDRLLSRLRDPASEKAA